MKSPDLVTPTGFMNYPIMNETVRSNIEDKSNYVFVSYWNPLRILIVLVPG
jgi:hypothetical protein